MPINRSFSQPHGVFQMGIHHIGGEASRGLRHPHGHSNEQYKRRGVGVKSFKEMIAKVPAWPVLYCDAHHLFIYPNDWED